MQCRAAAGVENVITDQYNQKVVVTGNVDPARVLIRVLGSNCGLQPSIRKEAKGERIGNDPSKETTTGRVCSSCEKKQRQGTKHDSHSS